MFEKFDFSEKQIKMYYGSAKRDLKIAVESKVKEVSFRFCYDSILKLSIAVCARKGLRVKARQGHHIELLRKLSEYLDDENVDIFGNDMRSKRNWDLYKGGIIVTDKEIHDYLKWTKEIFEKAEIKIFNKKQKKLL